MGCVFWLLFSRSTSTTFPLDRSPFKGESGSPVFVQNSQFGQIHLSIEAGVANHSMNNIVNIVTIVMLLGVGVNTVSKEVALKEKKKETNNAKTSNVKLNTAKNPDADIRLLFRSKRLFFHLALAAYLL